MPMLTSNTRDEVDGTKITAQGDDIPEMNQVNHQINIKFKGN